MIKRFRYGVGMALILFLASCNGGNDYRNALPEQSAAVVSVDMPKLASRAGLDAEQGDGKLDRFKLMVKSGLEGSGQLVDRIFSDVSESGIDLHSKVYFFSGEEFSTFGLLAKIKDVDKLEKLVEALHKEQICQVARETDGCKWTVLGKWLLAYSEDALLVLTDNKWGDPSNLVRQASMWLRQKEGQGFAVKSDFKQLEETQSDVAVWTTLQLFPRKVLTPFTMGLSAELDLKKIKSITAVNFEDGRVTLDVDPIITDRIMNDLIDKKMKTIDSVEGSYLEAFPLKTPFWATANIKGKSFYEFLREVPAIRNFFDYSDLPITIDYGRIFDAVHGDVAFAITDSKNGEFIIYANVNQTDFLSVFTELRPLLEKTNGQVVLDEVGENAYRFVARNGSVLNLRPGMKVFWMGVNKGRFYFTNSEELIDKRVLGLTLSGRDWGKRVPGQRFFAVTDWFGLSVLEYFMQTNLLVKTPKILPTLLEHSTVESNDGKHIHIELIQRDKKKNLLLQLLEQ